MACVADRKEEGKYPLCNQRITTTPWQVVSATSEQEIEDAIEIARENGKAVTVLNGGHNYEGFGAWNDALVIDVSAFKQLSLSSDRATATFGCAINNCDAWRFCSREGVVMCCGDCPTVSLTGLALCGGFNSLGRHRGMCCDNVRSMRVVTPKGAVVASGELLWGLSGSGAGNFGVVTEVTANVWPLHACASYRLHWERARGITISTWLSWIEDCPDELTPSMCVTSDGLTIAGIFIGAESELLRLLDSSPFKGDLAPDNLTTASHDADLIACVQAAWPPNKKGPMSSKEKSCAITGEIWPGTLQAVVAAVSRKQPGFEGAITFGAMGGQIRRGNMSFPYAQAKAWVITSAAWETPGELPAATAFVEAAYACFASQFGRRAYLGSPDLQVDPRTYYGTFFCRLARLKASVDPHNIFRSPQSLPRAGARGIWPRRRKRVTSP